MKTLAEISKITGIKYRRVKYYRDKNLIPVADWMDRENHIGPLYQDSDIIKFKRIHIYKELNYQPHEIRKIINAPGFSWEQSLQSQKAEIQERILDLQNELDKMEWELLRKDEYMRLKEVAPEGCVACGGPFPSCASSCVLLDQSTYNDLLEVLNE